MYNEKVMDHFKNPRNTGVIDDADGVGTNGGIDCSDLLQVYIKVESERIKDIKFQIAGCPAAIATSSILTELVKGKTIKEVLLLKDEDIVEALGGLPEEKVHCSNLGVGALHKALENYRSKLKQKVI